MNDEPREETEQLPDGRILAYPALTRTEQLILRTISKGIFISRYSLSWGYAEALQGKFGRLNKLARRMGKLKPLEVMVDDSDEKA